MAQNSYNTHLKYNSGTDVAPVWSELVPIKDVPDLGGDPEQIDVTTLSDPRKMNILGIESGGALTFTANYTLATYQACVALMNNTTYTWRLYLGEDGAGADGVFAWTGELNCYPLGFGVNAVREMKLTISVLTKPAIVTP